MTTSKPRPTIVHGETHAYPVLPLRDIVVFPHNIVPLFVGREKSIRALEEVMKNDALVMLATQKNASDDDPAPDNGRRSPRPRPPGARSAIRARRSVRRTGARRRRHPPAAEARSPRA